MNLIEIMEKDQKKYQSYFEDEMKIDFPTIDGMNTLYNLTQVGEQGYLKVNIYSKNTFAYCPRNSYDRNYKETVSIYHRESNYVVMDVFEDETGIYLITEKRGGENTLEKAKKLD